MTLWICPKCDREFAKARQAHTCVPGCTVEEVFAPWPPVYREIYDRLMEPLGPVHEDAVGVGVFLKGATKFAEVRPKARSLNLLLVMPRPITHPLISTTYPMGGGRTMYCFKFNRPQDVDGRILDWLVEAYDA